MGSRFFTFPPVNGAEVSYVVWHPKAGAPARTSSRPGAGDQVVVFVPGTDAVMFRTRLPGKRAAEILRAAAFAIEDELAVPAERTHVAVSERADGSGLRNVFAVDVDVMQGLVGALDGARLGNCAMVPELSVVPDGDALYEFGDRILGKVDQRAIAVDASWPADVQSALFKTPLQQIEHVADPLLQLAIWTGEASAVTDLRQGVYARAAKASIDVDSLKTPAMLLAALSVAGLVEMGLSVSAMNRLDSSLQSVAESTYRQTFGDDARGDLTAAVKTKLAAAPEVGNDFVSMSALLYAALDATPGVSVTSLRYDRDLGELSAALVYPAFGADLQIKSAAEIQGGIVRLGDTGVEDGRVVGDLTLEMRQ